MLGFREGCFRDVEAVWQCPCRVVQALENNFGHHRAACGRVSFAVERLSTDVTVGNHNHARRYTNSRQFEVVAEGVSLFGGVQLAVGARPKAQGKIEGSFGREKWMVGGPPPRPSCIAWSRGEARCQVF